MQHPEIKWQTLLLRATEVNSPNQLSLLPSITQMMHFLSLSPYTFPVPLYFTTDTCVSWHYPRAKPLFLFTHIVFIQIFTFLPLCIRCWQSVTRQSAPHLPAECDSDSHTIPLTHRHANGNLPDNQVPSENIYACSLSQSKLLLWF